MDRPESPYIEPEYLPPDAPILNPMKVPFDQFEAARSIINNLHLLSHYTAAFGHAVGLFQFCGIKREPRSRDLFTQWQFIAARDGAMSVYHCSTAMDGARGLFNRCPSWQTEVDHNLLREGARDLKRAFPSAENMRHAVAHAVELLMTPERHDQNSLRQHAILPGGAQFGPNNMVIGSLHGDGIYSFTHEGKMLNYSITPAAVSALNAAVAKFFSGFAALDARRSS